MTTPPFIAAAIVGTIVFVTLLPASAMIAFTVSALEELAQKAHFFLLPHDGLRRCALACSSVLFNLLRNPSNYFRLELSVHDDNHNTPCRYIADGTYSPPFFTKPQVNTLEQLQGQGERKSQ
ncbi:hypothetical protein CR51_35055 [Caballeronia megalochromosomata]|nr:hypothetical protein CR51_35055 [Caballeronia megalochromosomata]